MHLASKTFWILLAGLGAGLPLAAFGLFGLGPSTSKGQPFELTREKHSTAAWNTGGRNEWWTYQVRWRGQPLRFTAPEHRYPGDPGAPETFTHCSEGWGLGRTTASDGAKKGRVVAEALLVNLGPDPNNAPRWFLLEEKAGKLEATWLASTASDDPPVWQVWGPSQARPLPERESGVYHQAAGLGLVPLRRWLAGLALPAEDPPRYLLVGTTALVEVATRRVHALVAPGQEAQRPTSVRTFPLGLSPDGRSFLFLATRGEEQSGLEQVALATGEARWLPLDWKARHARHSLDLTRAWVEAALAWRAEAPDGPAWASWREGARYPAWAGRLNTDGPTSHYELEGYAAGILPEAVALLRRDLGATVGPVGADTPLDPGEAAHRLALDGVALRLGWSRQHGLYLYADEPKGADDRRTNAAIAKVAGAIDGALRAGRWQELVAR